MDIRLLTPLGLKNPVLNLRKFLSSPVLHFYKLPSKTKSMQEELFERERLELHRNYCNESIAVKTKSEKPTKYIYKARGKALCVKIERKFLKTK